VAEAPTDTSAGPGPEPPALTEQEQAARVEAAATSSGAPRPSAVSGEVERAPGAGRGRRPSRFFDLRSDLPDRYRWGLALAGLAGVFVLWAWAASRPTESVVVPSIGDTWSALRDLWQEGKLWDDLTASGSRILYGYSISMAIGIVVGVAFGSLRSVEATLEAPMAFMRYVPAAALTPLMMSWLGIDEAPKITLIVLGTVFFNILMVADVAKAVPRELIEASYTLGAGRWKVLRRVVFRHSLPGIIDVARVNLAAGWLMLVVAELLAANQGLAYRIVKAQRFHGYDTMFAVLFVFGVMGVVSDLALRWLRNVSSPWARP
jgi:NitT/TauT family transport system permease protein